LYIYTAVGVRYIIVVKYLMPIIHLYISQNVQLWSNIIKHNSVVGMLCDVVFIVKICRPQSMCSSRFLYFLVGTKNSKP